MATTAGILREMQLIKSASISAEMKAKLLARAERALDEEMRQQGIEEAAAAPAERFSGGTPGASKKPG